MFFHSKPELMEIPSDMSNAVGWLPTEYEPFAPHISKSVPISSDGKRKIIVPKKGPPPGDLPGVVKRFISSIWKRAEPAAGAARGNIIMGNRGIANPLMRPTYSPQVTPTSMEGAVKKKDETAIARDWGLMNFIVRSNGVTFRGDTRSPVEIINNVKGFHPPATRNDRRYLEGAIFSGFAGYYKRRYNETVTKEDFLQAVDSTLRTPEERQLFIDYMMWRQLMKNEEAHLARMANNELLKGYISTSYKYETTYSFGGNFGWVYLVIVHQGFMVPADPSRKSTWSTGEYELAQYGSIPAERIVGFRQKATPGPIFISRKFRKEEPEAFKIAHHIMSGGEV